MAYLSERYKHDIFVSYAHVNDETLEGEEGHGWVTTLVKNLETSLAQSLRPRAEFWMDYQLRGNEPLTPAIFTALEESAVLLIILSPAYLNSNFCEKENRRFLNLARDRYRADSRVFVVEYSDLLKEQEKPAELHELPCYPFWTEDRVTGEKKTYGWPRPSGDAEYFNRLLKLRDNMYEELLRLEKGEETKDPDKTVFLAQPTDDLVDQRWEVENYLKQHDFQVLPSQPLPSDPDKFRTAIKADLEKSSRFVQLLSKAPGWRPTDLPKGYLALQYELARDAGLPILQWRDRDLDTDSILERDELHHALLTLPTVQAMGIEEFKREIKNFEPDPPPPPPPGVNKSPEVMVFVDSSQPDAESATRKITDVLEANDIFYAERMSSGTPEQIREDLKNQLMISDVLLVVYPDPSNLKWVRGQLAQSVKIKGFQNDFWRGVLKTPPGPHDQSAAGEEASGEGVHGRNELGMKVKNLEIIDCSQNFEQTLSHSLLNFIAKVKEQRAGH